VVTYIARSDRDAAKCKHSRPRNAFLTVFQQWSLDPDEERPSRRVVNSLGRGVLINARNFFDIKALQ
jgi:hypothetical protein